MAMSSLGIGPVSRLSLSRLQKNKNDKKHANAE